jgi:hypothetical protein
MKRLFSALVLVLLIVGLMTAEAPFPNTTFTLVGDGLPSIMNVGDQYTVVVEVTSDQPFLSAQAMPSFYYPGKGVVAVQGGDHERGGTSALLEITYQAKSSTAKMEGGMAPVHAVIGVRYPGGYVAVKDYVFYVTVP